MSIRRGLHWVLTLAIVHLFTCVIPIDPASAAETSVESGIDRLGGDYKNFDLEPTIAGFGPCKSACESDKRCKAWTFVKPGVQGPKARCWLKDSSPNPVRNDCCVSGASGAFAIASQDCTKEGLKYAGNGQCSCPGKASENWVNRKTGLASVTHLSECVTAKEYNAAKAGGGGGSDDLRAAILRDAIKLLNQKVGGGQCTDFVSQVLADVHAKGGDFRNTNGDYIWGTKLNYPTERPQPGDIIQIYGAAKFTLQDPTGRRTGSWSTDDQHTAIIESVNGTVLNWIGQNAPLGSPVQRGTLDLSWHLDKGAFKFYRAVKP